MPLRRHPRPQRQRFPIIAPSSVGRQPDSVSAPLPRPKRLRPHLAAATALAGLTALALAGPALAGTIGTGTTTISYSGSIVDYTISTAGIYEITATGANGGTGFTIGGGDGITIGGDFSLSANQALDILVGGGGGGGIGHYNSGGGNYSGGGGGGGGYSGGGIGGGGGGGSYLASTVIAGTTLATTYNTGGSGADGLVTFTFVSGPSTPVPEPGSLALLGTGLLGLGLVLRRSRQRRSNA